MREPYCLRKGEIGELTPREIFDIYFAPRDEETGQVIPVEDEEPESMASSRKPGIQGVGGLDLGKHDCWKPQPGEITGDPFSVDREIVRQRIETFIYTQARKGLWEGGVEINLTSTRQTIKRPGIKRTDLAAMRDLVDFVWAEDCKKFDLMKREREKTNGIR